MLKADHKIAVNHLMPRCELCKLVYGFESPSQDTIFSTKHFLAFWETRRDRKVIVIIAKKHEWDTFLPLNKLEKDKTEEDRDLKIALERALEMLGQPNSYRCPSDFGKNVHFRMEVAPYESEGVTSCQCHNPNS